MFTQKYFQSIGLIFNVTNTFEFSQYAVCLLFETIVETTLHHLCSI